MLFFRRNTVRKRNTIELFVQFALTHRVWGSHVVLSDKEKELVGDVLREAGYEGYYFVRHDTIADDSIVSDELRRCMQRSPYVVADSLDCPQEQSSLWIHELIYGVATAGERTSARRGHSIVEATKEKVRAMRTKNESHRKEEVFEAQEHSA
jgi:hypothetical protein